MCGIIGEISTSPVDEGRVRRGLGTMHHRGPDDAGMLRSQHGNCLLGHHRLSIIDLSGAGHQPFEDSSGRYKLTYNGEIYNYLELRTELSSDYTFKTGTDTEVLLAAWKVWGESCLDRLVGMFAFAIWDECASTLTVVRDRFGVKPLFYSFRSTGELIFASEIKALHAAGVPAVPDVKSWCAYLRDGLYDHTESTFWHDVKRVPPGFLMHVAPGQEPVLHRWYQPGAERLSLGEDQRPLTLVQEELQSLFEETLRLRFRADVPVGICLSGGLDSSLILGLIRKQFPPDQEVQAFTFVCDDERYDERYWVEQMVKDTRVQVNYCLLTPEQIPSLASQVQSSQDEPFGGFPTLGMACVHKRAQELGITVLLDGNGVDESWAGYDYYQRANHISLSRGTVQGTRGEPSRESRFLLSDFARCVDSWIPQCPFGDPLLDLQYRDIGYTKITRAMRFSDRVSMQYSRELREPFLDHRLVELGLRQPIWHRIHEGQGKWLVRRVASSLLPRTISEAPKRPVQTPQREWLRGPLANWADEQIHVALSGWGKDWLNAGEVFAFWQHYREHGGDNSFPIWQWISLGLMQH